jgi:hypothetical protein
MEKKIAQENEKWEGGNETLSRGERESHPHTLMVLTPKFGKESDLWVQLGEKSVRRKEGFFRRIRQENPRSAICFRSARELLS